MKTVKEVTHPAKWWKSKTMQLAVLQTVAGVVAILATEYTEVGWLAIAKSVLDAALRYITTRPIEPIMGGNS